MTRWLCRVLPESWLLSLSRPKMPTALEFGVDSCRFRAPFPAGALEGLADGDAALPRAAGPELSAGSAGSGPLPSIAGDVSGALDAAGAGGW